MCQIIEKWTCTSTRKIRRRHALPALHCPLHAVAPSRPAVSGGARTAPRPLRAPGPSCRPLCPRRSPTRTTNCCGDQPPPRQNAATRYRDQMEVGMPNALPGTSVRDWFGYVNYRDKLRISKKHRNSWQQTTTNLVVRLQLCLQSVLGSNPCGRMFFCKLPC
jgi:hypothetical protein